MEEEHHTCDKYHFCKMIHSLPSDSSGIFHKSIMISKCTGNYKGQAMEVIRCAGAECKREMDN
ncbi:MAG: hypothetical protein PHS92_02785 [Candidatus Gracilibacteria bacterium]|nr:hypothetical protein [Candidatus Gracilibacteria bacterium]